MLRTMACLFILLWIGSKGAIVTRLQFSHNKGVWSAENNGLPKVATRRKKGELWTSNSRPSFSPPGASKQADASPDQSHVTAATPAPGEPWGERQRGAQLCPCFCLGWERTGEVLWFYRTSKPGAVTFSIGVSIRGQRERDAGRQQQERKVSHRTDFIRRGRNVL